MTVDENVKVSSGARAAIARAQECLRPYASEPRIESLLTKLAAIGDPIGADDDGDDSEGRLSKALLTVREQIQKSEGLPEPTKDRLRKAQLEVERELLAQSNPRAAEQWNRTWARIHGVEAA